MKTAIIATKGDLHVIQASVLGIPLFYIFTRDQNATAFFSFAKVMRALWNTT